MVKEPGLKRDLEKYLTFIEDTVEKKRLKLEKDLTFIEELIRGVDAATPKKGTATGRPEEKDFLYEIVVNKWNEIDVRKWDYFARDCHYLGIPNSFDHQRLLKSARVCDVDGINHICFRDKVADNVYDMFHTRYTLYLQAYQHKIVNIIEHKIANAFWEAKDTLEITLISESLSQDEMTKFIKLTDHIFEEILYSTDDELKGAREELEDVVRRRLPKCVGETRITEDEAKAKAEAEGKAEGKSFDRNWKEAVDEWNKRHPTVFLDKKDFWTEVITLDYNKKDGNPNDKKPTDSVYFYKKKEPTKGYKIKEYEVSSLLPEKFTERVGRVNYTKNSDEEEKDAKECFKWWRLGKCVIQVYDKEEFKGNNYFITGDYPPLVRCGIEVVRSCRVIRGVWKLYEGRDYNEPHYLLKEGEYPNPAAWGSTNPAQSLKRVTFKIQLYGEEDFEDPMHETTVDCSSVEDQFAMNAVHSCKVIGGVWKLYEGHDYNEPHYLLKEGEYPNPAAWNATNPAQSLKR
ncbi:hypothetical protein PO909_016347, partial [Leuciscus waleckii]